MISLKNYKLFLVIILTNFNLLFSQGTAGDNAKYETRYIVDMPTAGVIPNNFYSVNAAVYPIGGLMISADFGFWEFVNAGISFSGNNIVGDGDVEWQNLPGISLKVRIIDEKKSFPALVLGFLNQGSSNYIGDNRFKTHSPGFYLAVSKNYIWNLGNLAFHSGVNYSLEPKTENASPNLYFGLEQSLGKYIALNMEFNLQLDEMENSLYSKRGLLNTSLRGSITNGVTAELKFRDLLNHSRYAQGHERIVAIEIIKVLK